MTGYQWATIGLGALGFMITWTGMWFGIGRAIEQMKAAVKQDIEAERDRIVELVRQLEDKFEDEQKTQDQRFGEVGAAMRQYISEVEKKVREVEIWGRDHYVQKADMKAMVDQMRSDFKEAFAEVKEDIRRLLTQH